MAETKEERHHRAVALVEECLREGFTPERIPGPGNKTAIAEAATGDYILCKQTLKRWPSRVFGGARQSAN